MVDEYIVKIKAWTMAYKAAQCQQVKGPAMPNQPGSLHLYVYMYVIHIKGMAVVYQSPRLGEALFEKKKEDRHVGQGREAGVGGFMRDYNVIKHRLCCGLTYHAICEQAPCQIDSQ